MLILIIDNHHSTCHAWYLIFVCNHMTRHMISHVFILLKMTTQIVHGWHQYLTCCFIGGRSQAHLKMRIPNEPQWIKQRQVVADKEISACQGGDWDVIALPGGMPGAEHLRDNEVLAEMLKDRRILWIFFGNEPCFVTVLVLKIFEDDWRRDEMLEPGP